MLRACSPVRKQLIRVVSICLLPIPCFYVGSGFVGILVKWVYSALDASVSRRATTKGANELTCDDCYHDAVDTCSILLFVDEGRMFHQLLDHSQRYPDTTPFLMFTILPFCALTVHDSVRFVRRCFDPEFPFDSQAVNRLRNTSKSLSSRGLSVEEYALTTKMVTNALTASAKSHDGVFGGLLNAMRPDVAIAYYDGMPVSTTYNIARYIGQQDCDVANILVDSTMTQQLGFDIGQAASVNYYAVEALGLEATALTSEEFKVTLNEFHYSNLLGPLASKGISSEACFFMLSEIMTQLNSITALRSSGFFSDALQMKFGTAVLQVACRSINGFSRCAMPQPGKYRCTPEGATLLSQMIPRYMRKTIERLTDLRNAFVHYDFLNLIGDDSCEGCDPESLLEMATLSTVGMSANDYLLWTVETIKEISRSISELIELPACNPVSDFATNAKATQ